jgi:ABC-type transport system substrate-binding protein
MLVWIVTVALPPLLFLTGLLALGQAQAPSPKGSKKPIPEEVEEPIKPRAKVPLRVGEDDPDPPPREKPTGIQPADLAQEAHAAKNPVVRNLFLALKEPHDSVTVPKKGTLAVQPIRSRPITAPSVRLVPLDGDGKAGAAFLVEREAVQRWQAYEQLVLARVDGFLQSGLEKEPPASPRYLSRPEMLLQAEKVLAAAVNWHRSARERELREGKGWDEVFQPLQARLLAVQLEQLRALTAAGDWADAFDTAARLKAAYANSPEVQREFVKLHIQSVEQTLQGGRDADYIAAGQGLDRLEKEFLDLRDPEAASIRARLEKVRQRLRDRAAQLASQGQQLADSGDPKNKSRADTLLRTAEQIWPALPGVRDARLKLLGSYPILFVGSRHLPANLSPGTAVTDADRLALDLLFEELMRPVSDPVTGQRYEPALAQRHPRLVPLGRQFELAAGARWSTGEAITAADVHGTVQLLKRPDWLGHVPEWADLVEGAHVEDPFRVHLSLRRGYFDPLALMTFKVLPASRLRGMADSTFAANPVGSGPFQYQGRRKDAGRESVSFLANPLYSSRPGKERRPLIREIHFVRQDDPVAAWQAGAHLLLDLSADQVRQLEQAKEKGAVRGLEKCSIVTVPSRRVYFLAINHRRGDLKTVPARRAIGLALDRDKILHYHFRAGRDELKHLHHPLNGPFPRGCWACDPALDRDERSSNPDLARALAEKARLKDRRLTLKYPDDDVRVSGACREISKQLAEITGLELELQPLSPAALRRAVEAEHDYDLAYYHWDYETEMYWLWPLFDPLGADRGGRNFLGYTDDAELQSRFRQALSHRHFPQVQALYREIHKEIFAKMPLIPLWQLDVQLAIHADLQTVPSPRQLDPLRVFCNVDQWHWGK